MNVTLTSRKLAMAAALGLFAAGASAQAVPATWTVDPANTTLTIRLSALGGLLSSSGSASATGAQLSSFEPDVSIQALVGEVVTFDTITLTGFFAGTFENLGFQLIGGPAAIGAGGTADLEGFWLNVPTGIVNLPSFGLSEDLSLLGLSTDLPATDSVVTFLGSSSDAEYRHDRYGWLVPVAVLTSVDVSGFEVDVSFNGQIALETTLTSPVPEPATVVLMASGLAGFAALRRRRSSHQ